MFYLLMWTQKYDKNNKVNMDLMIKECYIMTIYTCMFDIHMKHLAQQMQNIDNENKKKTWCHWEDKHINAEGHVHVG